MHTALLDELPEKVAFREVGSRGTYQNPSKNGLKFGRCELCAACCLLVNHQLDFKPSLEGFLVTFGRVWVPKRVPNRSPNRHKGSKMDPLVPKRHPEAGDEAPRSEPRRHVNEKLIDFDVFETPK